MQWVEKLRIPLALLSALGCGVMAGLFFAFSNFVMDALARIPAGLAAMQSINRTVLNPTFFLVFLGTTVTSLLLIGVALLRWQPTSSGWFLAGSGLYLIGALGITAAFNVPLNESLAKLDPASPESDLLWRNYWIRWTLWNHARSLSSICATASFLMGLSRNG